MIVVAPQHMLREMPIWANRPAAEQARHGRPEGTEEKAMNLRVSPATSLHLCLWHLLALEPAMAGLSGKDRDQGAVSLHIGAAQGPQAPQGA